MDIASYNCMTPQILRVPRYDPFDPERIYRTAARRQKEPTVMVRYVDRDDIILTAEAGQYLYWMSVTKRTDDATNSRIFEYIRSMQPTVFAHAEHAIQKTKYTFAQYESFYSARVWSILDIAAHYKEVQEFYIVRTAQGEYPAIMEYYLELLRERSGDPAADYEKNEALIELIRRENYLLCAESGTVRRLYQQLLKCCAELEAAYMNA